MQRYYLDSNDQIVVEDTHPVSLRIVLSDDKVGSVTEILEQHAGRGLKMQISPILQGKSGYAKYQDEAASNSAGSGSSSHGAADDELEADEELDDSDMDWN